MYSLRSFAEGSPARYSCGERYLSRGWLTADMGLFYAEGASIRDAPGLAPRLPARPAVFFRREEDPALQEGGGRAVPAAEPPCTLLVERLRRDRRRQAQEGTANEVEDRQESEAPASPRNDPHPGLPAGDRPGQRAHQHLPLRQALLQRGLARRQAGNISRHRGTLARRRESFTRYPECFARC